MKNLRGVLILAALFGALGATAWVLYGPKMRAPTAAVGPAIRAGDYWTCGMHPQIHRDKPGRCPICGMDLVPASSIGAGSAETGVVRVDTAMAARLGIVTVEVESSDSLPGEIRTVGRLEPAQDRVVQVQTRMQGWIERLDVSAQGDPVYRGAPLLSIYSPEITAVEEEYGIALEAERRLGASPDPDARARGTALREGALERLRRLDLPEGEIERLVATGTPSRSFSVLSPASGYVLDLGVRRGAEVQPGQTLYTLADLSEVWLLADAYESEMDALREGAPAAAVFRQIPGETFRGRVAYVYPTIGAEARTNKLRIVLANPNGRLRPGMFADVRIARPVERGISIPLDAVVRTGTRDIAYVEIGPGRYEPRELHLGPQRDGRYLVLHGLARGERVVSRGAFFLDSEASTLRAVRSGAPAGHAGHAGMAGMK